MATRDEALGQYQSALTGAGGKWNSDTEGDFNNLWGQSAEAGQYSGAGYGKSFSDLLGGFQPTMQSRWGGAAGQHPSMDSGAYNPSTGSSDNLGSFGNLGKESFYRQFVSPTAEQAAQSPGWQFRLDEGRKNLEHSAAARGNLFTGGTGKALERYAQDYASNEYDKVYNRSLGEYLNEFNMKNKNRMDDWGIYSDQWNMGRNERMDDFNMWHQQDADQWNRGMGLANVGYGAARDQANLGANYGDDASELYTGMGNAGAAGRVGSGNAWGGFWGGVGNQVGGIGLANWANRDMSLGPAGGGAQSNIYNQPLPQYDYDDWGNGTQTQDINY